VEGKIVKAAETGYVSNQLAAARLPAASKKTIGRRAGRADSRRGGAGRLGTIKSGFGGKGVRSARS